MPPPQSIKVRDSVSAKPRSSIFTTPRLTRLTRRELASPRSLRPRRPRSGEPELPSSVAASSTLRSYSRLGRPESRLSCLLRRNAPLSASPERATRPGTELALLLGNLAPFRALWPIFAFPQFCTRAFLPTTTACVVFCPSPPGKNFTLAFFFHFSPANFFFPPF